VSPGTASQLAFVAALATYDATASLLDIKPPSPQGERGQAADNYSVPSPPGERDRVRGASPSGARPALRLKWPNDVLLGGAKLAGILIESVMAPKGGALSVAVGVGINAASAPQDTGRATATLGLGADGSAKAFDALARAFETWLARWDEGRAFTAIREAWLDHAHHRGEPINVRLNGELIEGRFQGVDERGALQLKTGAGVVITVNAGDIYPSAPLLTK
jgi:BirA family transcriptional regulator, biotin operon repressor / biotin---[acetyl-CoA-carboxylase] ligase